MSTGTEVAQQTQQQQAPQQQDQQQEQQLQTQTQQQQEQQLQTQTQTQQEEERPKYRTVADQQKADNLIKQQRREAGEQSNRSRSQSRKDRRKRIQQGIRDGKYMMTNSLEALEEADASGELQKMGMFERIGPDSTSMDGPVTHARAQRGEIPLRGTAPDQPKWVDPAQNGQVWRLSMRLEERFLQAFRTI